MFDLISLLLVISIYKLQLPCNTVETNWNYSEETEQVCYMLQIYSTRLQKHRTILQVGFELIILKNLSVIVKMPCELLYTYLCIIAATLG